MTEEIDLYQEVIKPYVKIGTSTDGDTLVQVMAETGTEAVIIYKDTIDALKRKGFRVANDIFNNVKVSNENTKFQKTVTVSGKGESVSKQWMEEMAK